jgi:hypothetical protein
MDICRCNRAGKREAVPIDQSTQFVPLLPFYSHHSRSIPFFSLDILCIRRTMREIDLLDLVPRLEQVEEDRLIHPLLTEFEMVPVNRRFGAVVRWNIEPGASGGQNVQDAVDQPAGITAGSANVRLCWGKVFLNNLPEIIVNFPECHDPRFYPRGLIIIGSPRVFRRSPGRKRREATGQRQTNRRRRSIRSLQRLSTTPRLLPKNGRKLGDSS